MPSVRSGVRPWPVRVLRALGVLALCVTTLLTVTFLLLRHGRPSGVPGQAAEELASRTLASVGGEAWESTGAVRWTFLGGRSHLWDRARMLDELRHGDDRVLVDLTTRNGRAWHDGAELTGTALRAALDDAYAAWCNDSFWLNPLAKFHDDGVTRSAVQIPDGGTGLLVSYRSGGMTPGDSYLWILGTDCRPRAWRMWVHVLPIPGLEASWEGWTRLSTGAWVSTLHKIAGVSLRIENVAGAATLAALVPGADPFAPLAGPTP